MNHVSLHLFQSSGISYLSVGLMIVCSIIARLELLSDEYICIRYKYKYLFYSGVVKRLLSKALIPTHDESAHHSIQLLFCFIFA